MKMATFHSLEKNTVAMGWPGWDHGMAS